MNLNLEQTLANIDLQLFTVPISNFNHLGMLLFFLIYCSMYLI